MGIGSPVSENEIMKAEDIQPSEMQGIDHFLKDSNHVEKPVEQNIDGELFSYNRWRFSRRATFQRPTCKFSNL